MAYFASTTVFNVGANVALKLLEIIFVSQAFCKLFHQEISHENVNILDITLDNYFDK